VIFIKYEGVINLIPPSDKALEFLKPKDEPIEIAEGAIRSSKTINCILKLISFMANEDMLASDALWAIGSRTINTCYRNVIRPFAMILNLLEISYDINKLSNIMTIDFSSDKKYEILILGFSDRVSEETIRGLSLSVLFLDEWNYTPVDAFMTAMDRCSEKGAKMLLTNNPREPSSWIYKKVIDNPSLDKYINYSHWTMDDNPSLTSEYIERVSSQYPTNSSEYRRKILGIRSSSDESVYGSYLSYYPSFNSVTGVFNDTDSPSLNFSEDSSNGSFIDFDSLVRSSHHPTIGMDYGAGSVTICPICSISADGHLLVIDEWYWTSDTIKIDKDEITVDKVLNGCISLVDKHFPGYGKPVPLQSPHDAAIIRSSIKATPTFNSRLAPITFKPNLYDNISLLQKLFYSNKILVHSRCKELINSLQSYSWMEDGERVDKHSNDHGADSLRGPVVYLNKLLGAIPKYAPSANGVNSDFERPIINTSPSLSYYYPKYS
jgi:PBSX family phage terminase large subunit